MPDENKLAHDDPAPAPVKPKPAAKKAVYYVKDGENREALNIPKVAPKRNTPAPTVNRMVRQVKPKK